MHHHLHLHILILTATYHIIALQNGFICTNRPLRTVN